MSTTAEHRVPEQLLLPLVQYYRPQTVILFGSKARGEGGPDSDFDLFVVVDDDIPADRLSWRAKHEARKNFHHAVDIVTCRAQAFRARKGIVGTLAHTAATEGIVVYER